MHNMVHTHLTLPCYYSRGVPRNGPAVSDRNLLGQPAGPAIDRIF